MSFTIPRAQSKQSEKKQSESMFDSSEGTFAGSSVSQGRMTRACVAFSGGTRNEAPLRRLMSSSDSAIGEGSETARAMPTVAEG